MNAFKLSVSFRITWLARIQRSRFDARARSLGLTSAQWRMIATIRLSEGVSQSEAATHLQISGVTAGRIIDRLEENGWVERRPDAGDMRANKLYVMPAAAPMLEQLSALASDEQRLALEGFSETEQATLAALLDRAIANMTAAKPVALPACVPQPAAQEMLVQEALAYEPACAVSA